MSSEGPHWANGSQRSSMAYPSIAELPGSPNPYTIPYRPRIPTTTPFRSPPPVPLRQPPMPERQNPRPPYKFVAIGIDFGTTFSGVSWAFSEAPDHIREISRWPSRDHLERDEPQVPSQWDLKSGKWGYTIARDATPLRWFKLLLLEESHQREDVRQSEYLRDARQQLQRMDSDGVINVVADYLRELWAHTLEEIKTDLDELDCLRFEVALTVPAIWPLYAREKMKEAARRAGITARRPIGETTLILVEEPEAAALTTLEDRRNYPEVGVGEIFVVCDCGGGTVDIISYKIVSTDPLKVEEAVKGDGKLCGAFLIDDAFENFMKLKSGLKFKECRGNEFRMFVNDEWEYTMKRAFSGNELQDTFMLRPPAKVFPAMKRFRGSTDNYALKKDSITQFYAETYSGICQLISDQKRRIMAKERKQPKKIMLVGGLGASKYLYLKLQELHGNVIQPQRAWSAVARGAVLAVLRSAFSGDEFRAAPDPRAMKLLLRVPEVESRVSRLNYGLESGVPAARAYPPVDRSVDRITKDPDGTEIVWRMKWYLKQNESVDNKDPVTCGFYEYVAGPSAKKTKFNIMTSDREAAPIRRDRSVQPLCTIECEYDTPWDQLPEVTGTDGRTHRRMDGMVLTMRFDGEPKWNLKVGRNAVETKVDVQLG